MAEQQWSQYRYTVSLQYADGRVVDVYGSNDHEEAHKDYCDWFGSLETNEVITWRENTEIGVLIVGRFTYDDALLAGI